jgi:hypothetical protein
MKYVITFPAGLDQIREQIFLVVITERELALTEDASAKPLCVAYVVKR